MRTLCPIFIPALTTALLLASLVSCKRDDMADQSRYKPYAASTLFPDGTSARPLVPNTVPRGRGPNDDGQLPWFDIQETRAAAPPFEITARDLQRGREQFDIYCSPCHGRLGDGRGMIVQRGFLAPPSYHTDRLRNAPLSYFYDVITNGYGAMFSYNDRVAPDDRWRIAAYIRALQYSQHAPSSDLPADARRNQPKEAAP